MEERGKKELYGTEEREIMSPCITYIAARTIELSHTDLPTSLSRNLQHHICYSNIRLLLNSDSQVPQMHAVMSGWSHSF